MAGIGRPPLKKQFIVDELRNRIISGEFPPGSRLPTRRECAQEFGATLATVQQALGILEGDGVIVSQGVRGTFVCEKPPHLNQFALAFPAEPGDQNWVLYWDHLASVGQRVVKEQGVRLSVYTGISKVTPGEDYERLLEDVRSDRVAGIIFASCPFLVRGTDILERPGIPRVVIGTPTPETKDLGHLSFDHQSFGAEVTNILCEKGIRHTAILGQPGNRTDDLLKRLEDAGIACPYHHQQAVPLSHRGWAKHVTRLMFDAGNAIRPEALVILDDNLFDPALAGILDAGLHIPQDLELISHSNFPWTLSSPVSVSRVGYDMHQALNLSLAELESQREGHQAQAITLSVVTEDGLPAYDQYHTQNATSITS